MFYNIVYLILLYKPCFRNPQILLIFHSWNLWNSCFRRFYDTQYVEYGQLMVRNMFWDLKTLQIWRWSRYLVIFVNVAHFPQILTKYTKSHCFLRGMEFFGMSSYGPESSSVEKFDISGSFFIYKSPSYLQKPGFYSVFSIFFSKKTPLFKGIMCCEITHTNDIIISFYFQKPHDVIKIWSHMSTLSQDMLDKPASVSLLKLLNAMLHTATCNVSFSMTFRY